MAEPHDFFTVRGYQRLKKEEALSASSEDYLEMIYRMAKSDGYARISALARNLNVSASSASKMTAALAEAEYIDYEKHGIIQMTEKGTRFGEYLLWRHETLSKFFELLCGSNASFFSEVEQMEHVFSADTVRRLSFLYDLLLPTEIPMKIEKMMSQTDKRP